MMHYGNSLNARQISQNRDAANGIRRGSPTSIAEVGADEVGTEERLGHAARVQASHCE